MIKDKFVPFGLLYLIVVALIWSGCSSATNSGSEVITSNGSSDSGWIIPKDEVYVGASKDQIPSIENPDFVDKEEINFMKPTDLVIGLKFGDEIRAYPHKVLNYHEIVNDEIDETPISLTFCPLTGSGLLWNRVLLQHGKTTFGVSGKIYKNNLIAYDRETESYWSQMLVQSVHGPLKGTRPSEVYHNMVEMTWEAWTEAFPVAKVLKGTPRLSYAYSSYPYGEDYNTNNENIVFPIGNKDDRLERKTLAHGISYNSNLTVFPIEGFTGDQSVINYDHKGGKVVLAGNAEKGLAVSFSRSLDGEILEFSPTDEPIPNVMEDNRGNIWNVFGEATSGPDEGAKLEPLLAFNAYWFAWADFYPDAEIYTPS